jgi:uncharacterized protein (DUF885 family)
VDTGIHAKGWTREQAREYFRGHTTAAEKDIAIEIDRCIVWPDQACAYMVGKKAIERLAERARSRLGSAFDLRELNDVILSGGAMPLPVLERRVTRWIEVRAAQVAGK